MIKTWGLVLALRFGGGRSCEISAGELECIGEHTDRKKEVTYDMRDLLSMFGRQKETAMAEHFERKNFELYRFSEIVRSYEDCKMMSSPEAKSLSEKNGAIKHEINVV